MKLIEIKNIAKKFLDIYAISNISFDVEKGEIHGLVGENGAGKTTLIKMISGVYHPTSGEFYWEGEKKDFHNPITAQKAGIGTIHQDFPLAEDLSVLENVMLGRYLTKKFGVVDWAKMEEKGKYYLNKYNINLDLNRLVKDLSIAERQLTAIIKAVIIDAKLIIMDEPTSALTENEKETLFKIIQALRESGIAVLYISHDLDDIMNLVDRVTIIRDGISISTYNKNEITKEKIIRDMVGRKLILTNKKTNRSTDEVVLEVKNLNITNKIKNVNFKLKKSEILGIGGLVGSGRSEIINSVFGNEKFEGEIYVYGNKAKIRKPLDAIKLGLGNVPEDRKKQALFMEMNIKENVSMPNLKMITKKGILSLKKENEECDYYVDRVKLKYSNRNQWVKYLSGGNQQKIVFARWAMNNPKILLLDEPTSGVDIKAKEEIYNIINTMVDNGVSVVIVSSDLQELMHLSDRIIVMNNGEISGELQASNFNQETFMELAIKSNEVN
jgi:ABC-type sugar transport system ATPase subunit